MISIKSDGKPARIAGIRPEMAIALQIAASVYADMGYDTAITSGVDGSHSRASKHYSGCALDLRTRHVATDVQVILSRKIAEALGDDFDVVLESNHLHIEFDPKSGINL